MSRSIRSINIPPSPSPSPDNPRTFDLLKIGLFKCPLPERKLCSNSPTDFFVKGKISDREFLHIDQSLKPRPCRPFLLSHLLAKGTIYLKHLHISRENTFIPLERLDNSGSNSPPKPGTDDGQMLMSCLSIEYFLSLFYLRFS